MRPVRTSLFRLVPFRSNAGIGLKTLDPIPKESFVIEYCGPLLTVKESDKVGGKYLFEVNTKWVIHGAPKYNKAGYINHGCKPNCYTKNGPHKKIYIVSKKNIGAGEELTYDYGEEYMNDFIRPIGCKCAHCLKCV